MWVTTKRVFLKSIKFTVYLKTLPHLLLGDESAWSVSQWSRNSYSEFLEKKVTPPQRLVINSFIAVVTRKKRVPHSELGLFGYSWYSYTGTFTICTNENNFLHKCFIISHTCLQCTAPLQQQKNSTTKALPTEENTHKFMCTHTLQPGSQKILHKAYFGRVSRTRSSVHSRLLCGYATDTKRD